MTKKNLINARNLSVYWMLASNEGPSASDLRDLVFQVGVEDFNDQPEGVLDGLVRAYMAQAAHEAEDDGDWSNESRTPDFELVSGNDAEEIFRDYSIRGYRSVSKQTKAQASDESVYECCDWYEPTVGHWPDKLLAELAFIKGRRAAREAIAMRDYFQAEERNSTPAQV